MRPSSCRPEGPTHRRWRTLWRRLARDERGAAAVLVAILFPILVGGMGLGAETGYWYFEQRKLQHAADVSAHAAGIRKRAGGDHELIEAAALHIATESGFWAPSGDILVNNPPQSGAFANDSSSVEVLLSRSQRRLFSAIFNKEAITISSRAVAKIFSDGGRACALALSPNASGAFTVTGSSSITLTGCDLASNSSSESSFSMPNNAAAVTAGCVHSVGGIAVANPANMSVECSKLRTYAQKVPDPYADVAEPVATGACESTVVGQQNTATTLTPTDNHPSGMKSLRFCNGMTVRGDVTFEPGLYIIEGGDVEADFTSGGNSSMSGEGVVFYLKNARIKLNANLTSQLSAPTSGAYAGILFFGSRESNPTSHSINGTSSSSWTGAIYAPTSHVQVNGNSSSAGSCTQVIANTITFSGNSSLQHDCTGVGTKDIMTAHSVRLVE